MKKYYIGKGTVCIDFDGVLSAYKGWKGPEHTEPPVPGAKEFVQRLIDEGYKVMIHTTRDMDVVSEWLSNYDFPEEVVIVNYKPPALVYIDDRAHRFDGDWDSAYRAIHQKPWWANKEEKK